MQISEKLYVPKTLDLNGTRDGDDKRYLTSHTLDEIAADIEEKTGLNFEKFLVPPRPLEKITIKCDKYLPYVEDKAKIAYETTPTMNPATTPFVYIAYMDNTAMRHSHGTPNEGDFDRSTIVDVNISQLSHDVYELYKIVEKCVGKLA